MNLIEQIKAEIENRIEIIRDRFHGETDIDFWSYHQGAHLLIPLIAKLIEQRDFEMSDSRIVTLEEATEIYNTELLQILKGESNG